MVLCYSGLSGLIQYPIFSFKWRSYPKDGTSDDVPWKPARRLGGPGHEEEAPGKAPACEEFEIIS